MHVSELAVEIWYVKVNSVPNEEEKFSSPKFFNSCLEALGLTEADLVTFDQLPVSAEASYELLLKENTENKPTVFDAGYSFRFDMKRHTV